VCRQGGLVGRHSPFVLSAACGARGRPDRLSQDVGHAWYAGARLALVGVVPALASSPHKVVVRVQGLKKSEQQPLLAAFKAQLTIAEEDGSEAPPSEAAASVR
jgi:hypothetical protein